MPDPQKDYFSQFEEPSNDYFSQFEEVPKEPEKPKEPSLFEKGLNLVTTAPKTITDWAAKKADEMDAPVNNPNEVMPVFGAQLRGFSAGALKGAASLLSPLNIASVVAPESRLATALYGAQGLEGANEIRKGNYLTGAADLGMSALGIAGGGSKGKLKEAIMPKEGEVMPSEEIPIPKPTEKPKLKINPDNTFTNTQTGETVDQKGIPVKPIPKNDEGIVTTKETTPEIRQAEVVSEIPNSVPSEVPEVKLRGPAQEYIDAVKSGQINRSTSFTDFQKNKSSLMSRFVKEESGSFSPFEMFKKVKGVDDAEANKVRESVIDTLIQGGRLDLEGIYGKTIGMNRKQFNKIVDEIIDTGSVGKIAEQIKINTPEPIQRLLGVLSENKVNRALQDAMVSQERGKRFAAFGSQLSKGQGKEGALKATSAMSGEYPKISPAEIQLGPKDTDALFDQIKNNTRITPAEKLRAIFTLRDLMEGTRTLQPNELQLMDRIYGPGIGNQIIMMHGGLGGVGIKLAKTANTMKSMNATLDLSAPFRQGLGLVHRKEFWDAFVQMHKYAGSEEAFQALGKSIEEHPNYLLSRDAGLFTADHTLGNFEEQFMDSYLNDIHKLMGDKAKYSPARASERAYVGFLNKLRFDTFNSLLEKAEKGGLKTFTLGMDGEKYPTDLTREISKYVNTATGRGDLGKFAKYGDDLNNVLFSPRLIASRLTILNPKYYIDANPFVRKEALKTLFALAGFTVISNGVGSIIGGQTKLTPNKSNLTNPDYGKVKFNNTRLDPNGGLMQYIVAASQFITGQSTSSTGGNTYDSGQFGQPGKVGKLIGVGNPRANSFLENKMSPMASLIDTIVSGKIDPATRKPYDIPTEIRKRFTPLIAQDMMDLYKSDPELLGLGIPATYGMGLQTYGGSAPSGMQAPKMSLKP